MTKDEQKKAIREKYMIKLKGKDYLPVAPRVLMFRIDHELDVAVTTEIVDLGGVLHVKASVSTTDVVKEDGAASSSDPIVVATAHKRIKLDSTSGASADWPVETAETGAIGRALSLCGYGTIESGDDLEEDGQIADAPVSVNKRPASSSEPVVTSSKFMDF